MSFTWIKHVESVETTEHSEGIDNTPVYELEAYSKDSIYRAKDITNFSKETLSLLEECNDKYSKSFSLIRSNSMLDPEHPNDINLAPVREPVPSARSFDCSSKEVIWSEPLFETIITQVNYSESFEVIATHVNESECSKPKSSIPSREHEYDTAPTELFQALEARQFDKALSILEDSSPEQIKDPNALSGLEQANTWIYRKNEDDGEIRWRVLPLHAAIIFGAPIEVVDLIIDLSPISTKLVDDTGKLPIHLAFFKNVDKKIIQKLLTVHPECVRVKDGKGRLPHQCAVKEMELLSTYAEIAIHMERQQIIKEFRGRQDRQINKYKNKLCKQVSKLKKSYKERFSGLKQIHNILEEEYLESREDPMSSQENCVRGGRENRAKDGRENCAKDGRENCAKEGQVNVKPSFGEKNEKQTKADLDEGGRIEDKLNGLQDGLKVLRNHLTKSQDAIKAQSNEARRQLETWKLEKMLLSIELDKDYDEIKDMNSKQVQNLLKEVEAIKVRKTVEAE